MPRRRTRRAVRHGERSSPAPIGSSPDLPWSGFLSRFDAHGGWQHSGYASALKRSLSAAAKRVSLSANASDIVASAQAARDEILPLAVPAGQRAALAVATLHYGQGSSSCGLIKWCYAAASLAAAPFLNGRAEAVVLAESAASIAGGCWPIPRVVPFEPALLRLVQRWSLLRQEESVGAERSVGNGHGGNFSHSQLMKLQLVSMAEYSYILYLDSDVDLFLHSAGQPPPLHTPHGVRFATAWTHALAALAASGSDLLASRDPHAPINGGVFVLRPSART